MASATASTTLPPPPRAAAAARPARAPASLSRRLLLAAAVWIVALLGLGGFALDRVVGRILQDNFDEGLEVTLTAMVAFAQVGPSGEVRFGRPLADQRFFEPYSGLYWQVLTAGQPPFRSASLFDRRLGPGVPAPALEPRAYDYAEGGFEGEPLRVVERDAVLPGARTVFRFQAAQSTRGLRAQQETVRRVLLWSLSALGAGMFVLAAIQASYGLSPLGRVRRAIADVRAGRAARVPADVPPEVRPLVTELNGLLDHAEAGAEEARRHAGNLAHALKTPMTVLLNEARGGARDLPALVEGQLATMQRHVDHHLARARAVGRRAAATARAEVWPAVEAVARAVERMHAARGVVVDVDGERGLAFRGERQDLEEMLGNLVDNAAKYGGGRVFVTVGRDGVFVVLTIEDDGPGIPEAKRGELFGRGARLDTGKPGTGLGLAIARDVAEIYGGSVALGESEDLGGLCAVLRLPLAA